MTPLEKLLLANLFVTVVLFALNVVIQISIGVSQMTVADDIKNSLSQIKPLLQKISADIERLHSSIDPTAILTKDDAARVKNELGDIVSALRAMDEATPEPEGEPTGEPTGDPNAAGTTAPADPPVNLDTNTATASKASRSSKGSK